MTRTTIEHRTDAPTQGSTGNAPQGNHQATLDAIRAAAQDANRFVYLVIGPNVWGKGFTQEQAQEAAGKPKHWILYACTDPWCRITGMGDIQYLPPAVYWELARKGPKTEAKTKG